uniref:Uncharacterized protein n=1 Tax=Chrysotila carterae TaxID=13221 RepID=A0A7S4C0U6_CHRCT
MAAQARQQHTMLALMAALMMATTAAAYIPAAPASRAPTFASAARSASVRLSKGLQMAEATDAELSAAQKPTPVDPANNPAFEPFTEVELAEQSAKLDALAKKWRKRQLQENDAMSQQVGFCLNAEQINGRSAMFFLLTGLVTEYYTGESVPQQCYTLFQTLGLVD